MTSRPRTFVETAVIASIIVVSILWMATAAATLGPGATPMSRRAVPPKHSQGGASHPGGATRSVWDEVYSDAQAVRGRTAYVRECAACHGEDLRGIGPAPALGPDDFLFVWENRTLGDLFERIRTTMPPDRPDSLAPETYRDIVAFLLSASMFPAGDSDLGGDIAALREVVISAKPRVH